MGSDTALTSQVLIAGGGPFGLMLSIELSRRGVPSLLVDAKPRTAVNPQANATQARTMEYYRRLGFAEEIRALGLPLNYPTDIAYFTRYSTTELARFELPSAAKAEKLVRTLSGSWSAAELPHRVAQKYVEEVLRNHAESNELATVRYGWKLRTFSQSERGVEATVENTETGELHEARASFLIGADGAQSTVRRILGISHTGETGVIRDFFGGRMIAVYLRAPEFYKVARHPRAWMYWAFNAERRSWLAAVNGTDEFAFHTQLKPGEDENITEARARELFHQVMGMEFDFEILDIDTWIAGHALVAERFIDGRIIIGGDAAHLFTPAGGLGYNTAVEDAVNLSWKLAAVLGGQGGRALIESYEYERQKLARRNTGYARDLADSIGNFLPCCELEEDSPRGRDARAAAGEYLEAHARREFNIPGITFGGRYDGSPIIVDDGSTEPEDLPNSYTQSAKPGGRAPHMWLDDGSSIFDTFGFGWTLLLLGKSAGEDFQAAAQRAGVDLKLVKLLSDEARELYQSDCILIRPDQVVAWRNHGDDYDTDSIFRQVLGRNAEAGSTQPGQ